MAKWRALHASITTDGKVNRMSEFAQLLYDRIVVKADDWGVITGDTFELKAETVPGSSRTFQEIDDALQEMVAQDLIWRYEPNGSGPLLQVRKWDEHQPKTVIGKRTIAKYPLHPEYSRNILETPGKVTLDKTRQDKNRQETDIDKTTSSEPDAADVSEPLINSNKDYLSEMGVHEPKRTELAGLAWVNSAYLDAWAKYLGGQAAKGNILGTGFLVTQIKAGAWP